ncbi:glycosyltransferase family 4 protein [Croceibacterium mercuriale]|uniref:glycosyltransferase family 4 protein n=1 Tax=Croceibacterium mercuriale TaxID=1572751 RepID=UPI00068BC523|nr:glycosyltransferase [Croceibacterium mercuriale]
MSSSIRRIVMVAPHFEEYAFLLARALAREAAVLLVVDTARLDADYQDRPRPAAAAVTLRHCTFGATELPGLALAIARFRPDVLHWQEPSGLVKAVMAAVTVTLAGPFCRTALTIHDAVPHSGRDATVAARLAPVRRFTRARVQRLFVHGPSCAEQYLQEYLPAPHRDPRLRLTEHGTILAGPAVPPPAGFRVLMFGRMEAYKGLDVLLEAWRLLVARGVTAALELAGSGPELDQLGPEFAALPGVTVTPGYISSAQVIAKIGAADALVLPYHSATQSGVLAAAMGNGRFAVASRVGGIPDTIEHGNNGLLVEPGDAAGLADALARLANDPALRRHLQSGAARTAATRLDWELIAQGILADY